MVINPETGKIDIVGNLGSARLTPEGGFAVLLTNKTGAASVKGNVVHPSPTVDDAFVLSAQDIPDPIGVVYESGAEDGTPCWVVIAGRADVYFIGSTNTGHLARGFISSDAGFVAGQALSEAVPTSPFATDKHFISTFTKSGM